MQIKFSVAELLKILQGDLLYSKGLNEGGVLDLQSEKTLEHDSRKPLKGNIFLALKGESFDGHDFLMGAQEAGADLAIVDRRALVGQAVLKMPLLVVENTLLALHQLARNFRAGFNGLIIGITGSNGKTTLKTFLCHLAENLIPGKWSGTPGNLNNHFGLPFSILNAQKNSELHIFEIGINHKNEMDLLAATLRPDICLISSISDAHREGLGGASGAWQEKTILAQSCETMLFSQDCIPESAGFPVYPKKLSFGCTEKADFRFSNDGKALSLQNKTYKVKFPLPGKARYACLASGILVFTKLGFEVEEILRASEGFKISSGRLNVMSYSRHILVDDSYNANKDSMFNLADSMLQLNDKQEYSLVAFIGDMAELGDGAQQDHLDVLSYFNKKDIGVFSCGPRFLSAQSQLKLKNVKAFENQKSLKTSLETNGLDFKKCLMLSFKGSRSSKMENILNWILDHFSKEFKNV